VEWEEHGMGSVHSQSQIVRMLHNGHNASDAIHRDHERRRRLVMPNLEHVVDHKAGNVSKEPTEVSKRLKL
jgi:hypothetical protein